MIAAREKQLLQLPAIRALFPQGVPSYSRDDSAQYTAQLLEARGEDGTLLRKLGPDEELFLAATRLRITFDAPYFLERFVYIDEEGHGLRPLYPLWESQKCFLNRVGQIELERVQQRHLDGILINCLKARQLGASTISEALVAHRILTRTHTRALVGADVEGQAAYLFSMVARIYDNLPWFLRPDRITNVRGKEMVFSNGSILNTAWGKSTRGELQEVAGRQKGHIARGKTFSVVHISELSTWDNPGQLDDSLLPAIPMSPLTLVLFESTAKGAGNWWHNQWLATEEGVGRFQNLFIPWGVEPSKYSIPAPVDWDPSETTLQQARKSEQIWPKYIGRSITLTRDQLYFYETTRAYYAKKGDIAKFLEEYACLDGDTRVGTQRGIIPLREVVVGDWVVDGQVVHAGQTGVKPVYEVLTEQGRRLVGTPEHRVFLVDGCEREIQALQPGDALALRAPLFGTTIPRCEWSPLPGYSSGFDLSEDWALLLGYFMGDGCYYKDRLDIAADARDTDVVEEIAALLQRITGVVPKPRTHTTHGISLSVTRQHLRWPFLALGTLYPRPSDRSWKRRVSVPEIIWRAPKVLVRVFLSALFEADGHRYKKTARIGFFAKDLDFVRDVQQLLLGFGITSTIRPQKKYKADRTFYSGYALDLAAESARVFQAEIGFRGARKSLPWVTKHQWRVGKSRRANILRDCVVSVRPLPGVRPVYDLTTSETHRFDAGGLLVHNSDPEECFLYSGKSVFTLEQLEQIDQKARPLIDVWKVEPARDIAELRRETGNDPPSQRDSRPPPPMAARLLGATSAEAYPIPPGYGFRRVWGKDLKNLPNLRESVFALWEYPRSRGPRRYIMPVDVGDGLGGDYSVIDIVRQGTIEEPAEQVGQFVSNRITPTQLAFVCDALGRLYTDEDGIEACAAIECNNHGLSVQDTLQLHLGYTNFYVWEYADSASPDRRFSTRIGWLTTERTRPILLDKFHEAITTLDPITGLADYRLNSPVTRAELRHFLIPAEPGATLGDARAASGQHDDAVMCGAIGYYVAYRHAGGEQEPIAERRRRREALKALHAAALHGKPDYRNTAVTMDEADQGVDHAYDEFTESPAGLHFDSRASIDINDY